MLTFIPVLFYSILASDVLYLLKNNIFNVLISPALLLLVVTFSTEVGKQLAKFGLGPWVWLVCGWAARKSVLRGFFLLFGQPLFLYSERWRHKMSNFL